MKFGLQMVLVSLLGHGLLNGKEIQHEAVFLLSLAVILVTFHALLQSKFHILILPVLKYFLYFYLMLSFVAFTLPRVRAETSIPVNS